MAATVLNGIDAIREAKGTHLGYSDWITVSQERVNQFADFSILQFDVFSLQSFFFANCSFENGSNSFHDRREL